MVEKVEIKVSPRTAENKYKVPKKQWRKWSVSDRKKFNEVYSTMALNQAVFLHPKSSSVAQEQWKTVCWNAAWTAADA